MAGELVTYPRGALAMGNGELLRVNNINFQITNNAKLVHTLRQDGDGVFFGVVESNGSFDFVVPAEGPERDYIEMCEKKETKQFRFKFPGENITVNGAVASVSITSSTDNEVSGTVNFIGKKT